MLSRIKGLIGLKRKDLLIRLNKEMEKQRPITVYLQRLIFLIRVHGQLEQAKQKQRGAGWGVNARGWGRIHSLPHLH